MILVAGLAVAGLAGIAAAFYFSMHPGGSRVRAARPGRAGDGRRPAGKGRTSQPPADRSDRSARSAEAARPARSAEAARPARSARSAGDTRPARSARSAGDARTGSGRAVDRGGSSTVIDFTGPQPVLDDEQPAAAGRRSGRGDHLHDTSDEPRPGHRAAARRVRQSAADDAAEASRSRRRVAWRKGSDVDAELWPAAAFGGVSDEQFWDDLAADKPLATTARAAQPGTAARRRPPSAGPLPDLNPADDRGRGNGRRGAAEGPGTHPQPRLGPDDRIALQPVQAATQPPPTPPAAAPTYPTATQHSSAATQPVRPNHQGAESRERSRSASTADEDPLTSPAYSLRSKGSVNGQPYPSAGGGYADTVPALRQLDPPSHGANGRGRSDAGRTDPLRSNGYRSDPLRSDPLRPDPLRSDPLRSDPLRSDPLRSDPLRSDPLRPDPLRPDPLRSDPLRPDPLRPDPLRPDPLRPDPLRPDPLRPDPLRPDPLRLSSGYVASASYPYPQPPYSGPAQAMGTSPYGERYGYGTPASSWVRASPGSGPRRANGRWSPSRADGNGAGDGYRGSRAAYPSANSYRAPYYPRGYDRPLSSLR
jgi:hypothetical protein